MPYCVLNPEAKKALHGRKLGEQDPFAIGIPLVDAVRTATLTPAEILDMDDSIGSIAKGKRANLCLLDQDLNLKTLIVDGMIRLIDEREG